MYNTPDVVNRTLGNRTQSLDWVRLGSVIERKRTHKKILPMERSVIEHNRTKSNINEPLNNQKHKPVSSSLKQNVVRSNKLFIGFYFKYEYNRHDVSSVVVPSQFKDLFVPTEKKSLILNTRSSVSTTFVSIETERKSFSRIGAKLWNEIPTQLRALPKLIFN